jgi:Family of unknown function (DUF6263)
MTKLELRIEKEEFRTVKCDYQFLILNSKFLICCVSLLLCSNAMADSLKFKFASGDRYSLVSVTEQKMARVVDGNERVVERTTQFECDFDIEEVDEAGLAWAKYTYRRVIAKVKSPDLNFTFDSDANQLKMPIQAMPLRQVIGEELYLRITPQGRIEKINGLQALSSSAKAKTGNFASAGTVNQSITQRFTEPTIRRELEDQFRIFPESNEGGVTWSRTEILSSTEAGYAKVEQLEEVNVVFEKTFRLNPPAASQSEAKRGGARQQDTGGRSGIAVVDVNLVIKSACAPVLGTPPDSGRDASWQRDSQTQASESPIRATREISGEGAGRIEIEEATGRIINSKMTQDATERVKYITQGPMLRPPPAPEPSITHTVTTFQMTKREPPAPSDVEGPAPGKVEGDKPARPADANEKGSPSI